MHLHSVLRYSIPGIFETNICSMFDISFLFLTWVFTSKKKITKFRYLKQGKTKKPTDNLDGFLTI